MQYLISQMINDIIYFGVILRVMRHAFPLRGVPVNVFINVKEHFVG